MYNLTPFSYCIQDFTSVLDSLLDERNDIAFAEKGREVCSLMQDTVLLIQWNFIIRTPIIQILG